MIRYGHMMDTMDTMDTSYIPQNQGLSVYYIFFVSGYGRMDLRYVVYWMCPLCPWCPCLGVKSRMKHIEIAINQQKPHFMNKGKNDQISVILNFTNKKLPQNRTWYPKHPDPSPKISVCNSYNNRSYF